jgi:hypothetical protein
MKTFIVTEDQMNELLTSEIEEATSTFSAGNYAYTVPFGGDKETTDRSVPIMHRSFNEYGK